MPNTYFSIIIPTYNRASFIENTVKSALQQDYDKFEVIVVDDGSTDTTEIVIKNINNSKIRYYYKDNAERAAARNFGVKHAKGDYVCFLDSDDFLYPNHLSIAVETIVKYKYPEFFGLGYEARNLKNDSVKSTILFPEIANETLIRGNNFSCNAIFIRKDIALLHPFNEIRSLSGTEDYELWFRLAARYNLYFNNKITSAIVQHDSRSIYLTNEKKLLERILIMEESLEKDIEFIKKFGKDFPIIKANNRLYIALNTAIMKKPLSTLKYLLQAVSFSKSVLLSKNFFGPIKKLVSFSKF